MSDHSQIIDDVQQHMISSGLASSDSIIGCSEGEIQALEKQYDIRFPAIYRTFLARMGHGAGDFYVGTNWTYPDLSDLRRAGESLIGEARVSYRLPNDVFVFAMHQGYSFPFFHSVNDDPSVWLYEEWMEKPKEVAASFSCWLRDTVAEHIH